MDAESFLSNTISILATSADLCITIDNLARLAAKELAESCAVFMFENEQTVRRLALANRSESTPVSNPVDLLYPLDLQSSIGPGHVLRTGESEMLANVTPEVLEYLGVKPGESPPSESERTTLYLCMPIVARGRTIGAIAFLSRSSRKTFGDAELSLMAGLTSAAGVAIDNAKLYRDAQEANRLKDEFVAMVSHELRTPLTPMLGCIHLLRTAKLSQVNFDRTLEMMERNAHTQVQIVEDLLDASKIVSGKLHLLLKSTPIMPAIEAAIASVRGPAEAKGIRIITNFQDVQQLVDGDAHRLQQIVWNLLSNAVKFTPADGRIEISVKPNGDHVQIQVTDTGVGIPADILPSIFNGFRQSIDGNSKLRTGLGLGLAIVRHLVELHNGSIAAASAGPGQGAVFTLKFPFVVRKAAIAAP